MIKLRDICNDTNMLSDYVKDNCYSSYGSLSRSEFISNISTMSSLILCGEGIQLRYHLTQRYDGMFSHFKNINDRIIYIDDISVSDFVKYYSDISEYVLAGYSLSSVAKYAIGGNKEYDISGRD